MTKSIIKRQEEVARLMDLLIKELDLISVDEENTGANISAKVLRHHRSTQQNFWRVVYHSQRHYAKYAKTDHRNEVSKDWCTRSTSEATQFPYF